MKTSFPQTGRAMGLALPLPFAAGSSRGQYRMSLARWMFGSIVSSLIVRMVADNGGMFLASGITEVNCTFDGASCALELGRAFNACHTNSLMSKPTRDATNRGASESHMVSRLEKDFRIIFQAIAIQECSVATLSIADCVLIVVVPALNDGNACVNTILLVRKAYTCVIKCETVTSRKESINTMKNKIWRAEL